LRGYSSIARAGRLDDGGNRFAMSALEKYGAIWLSFAATPKPIFDIPEFLEPVRRVVSAGATRIHVSGLRAIENFLDMAHFPFVHTDILGAEPLTESSLTKSRSIRFITRSLLQSAASPSQRHLLLPSSRSRLSTSIE